MSETRYRSLAVDLTFSLAETCGPAAWVGHRSPRQQWEDGALTTVEWEDDTVVWRKVWQPAEGGLELTGTADPARDEGWARRVLGIDIRLPVFEDPVIACLAGDYGGLRPLSDGSLFDGIITSIVGQSISVAAAAVTQAKLASRFCDPLVLGERSFRPLPTAEHLAEASVALIRESGVTWKRAEALKAIAERKVRGEIPTDDEARAEPEEVVKALVGLPGVGRWTAESAVLWGVGAPNAHPTGDIALLRAAKTIYERPELTLKELDHLAEAWQPARALAARLLWTKLFGPAPG